MRSVQKRFPGRGGVFRLIAAAGTSVAIVLSQMCPTYAAGPLTGTFAETMGTVYTWLTGFGVAFACIALVVCGIMATYGGEKGMEYVRKWALRIFVTIAVILLLPNMVYAGWKLFYAAKWGADAPPLIPGSPDTSWSTVVDQAQEGGG